MSTVKVRLTGAGSGFPRASVPRTAKVCSVWLRFAPPGPVTVYGELHDEKAPPSTEHSKVVPGSGELNVKVGVGSLVSPLGPLSIWVPPGVVSTLKERKAGVASVFPEGSVARTRRSYEPSARTGVV